MSRYVEDIYRNLFLFRYLTETLVNVFKTAVRPMTSLGLTSIFAPTGTTPTTQEIAEKCNNFIEIFFARLTQDDAGSGKVWATCCLMPSFSISFATVSHCFVFRATPMLTFVTTLKRGCRFQQQSTFCNFSVKRG